MNIDILQWIFLINFVFLMMHETDASFWKEWKYFGKFGESISDEKGLTIFILARLPFCIPLLYGLIHIDRISGKIISLIFSAFLIFHFFIHMSAIKKGRKEFSWPISYFIQVSMLIISIFQLIITMILLFQAVLLFC